MEPITSDKRINAVKQYLAGDTLEHVAALHKVHRNTIWRWVKRYKQGRLVAQRPYPVLERHWKKLPKKIEDTVVYLKESIPSLTVRKAQDMLKRKGITISIKGVWSIWNRYNLIGFARVQLSPGYQNYIESVVPHHTVNTVRRLIKENKLKEAADLINSMPDFPHNEILLQIPQHLFSLRHQVNRICAEFGKTPLQQFRKKAVRLRKKLEKGKLFYSSLWVAVVECYALMWSGQPLEMLKIVKVLKRRMHGMRDPRLRFVALLIEGQAYGNLLRTQEAKACTDECKRIIRHSRNPYFFMGGLGGIYSIMGYYREALKWTTRALRGAAPSYRQQLYGNLAGFLTIAGDYRAALSALRKAKLEEWGFHSRTSIVRAFAYLDKGDFQRASAKAVETLAELKKEGARRFIHPSNFILACCHQAAGARKTAYRILREANPLLKKYGLLHEYLQRRIIQGHLDLPKESTTVPSLRLVYLLHKAQKSLRAQDYRQALHYAHAQKLFGLFKRLAPFFPEPVVRLMKKGKNPGLPRTYLEMPVFHIDSPVYNVNFLGKLHLYKKGKRLYRVHLSPKDASFLIHMAQNKKRKMQLDEVYRNFWLRSKDPSRNLSHLLLRLKKNLAFSPHLVRIRSGFLYWRIYFVSDYHQYLEIMAQARMFEKAGEWNYAMRGFLRAFQLFRGKPFEKMYDRWSEDLRRVILYKLEIDALAFKEFCIKQRYKRNTVYVMNTIKKIIPV